LVITGVLEVVTKVTKKQRLGPKLAGIWVRGASKKLDPLLISAIVEASNCKFGTQLVLGVGCKNNT